MAPRNVRIMPVAHRLLVPATFWRDHADRCPCDDPETGMCTALATHGQRILIEGTADQIETLRSDAAYYCDRWGPDETPPDIKRSAARTLEAIKAAGIPRPTKATA